MSARPTHIALFLPDLRGGGTERKLVNLAIGFSTHGFQVSMVLVQAKGVFLSHLPSNIRLVDLKASSAYTAFPSLVRYLWKERPNVLLSALDLTNLIAVLAKLCSNVPVRVVLLAVNTVTIQKRSRIKKILERILLRSFYPLADNIVAVSQGVARDLAQYASIHPDRIRTIYNPVINDQLYERAGEPNEYPWLAEGSGPLILGAGRLTMAKDFFTLIRALAIVRQSVPARLMILGEGEERRNLEALAGNLGLSSEVCLPGFVENPFSYMKKSAVFVLSSVWEGLPTVLIEALACGCPVVSTDCPSGPIEILDNGRYGHLVPIGDADAMAAAILRVLNGDERKPPESWLSQFKQETIVLQYLDALGVKQEVESGYPFGVEGL